MTAPTRILLRDGTRIYCDTPPQEMARVVESARKRGDENVRIDGRVFPLYRVAKVLAPMEENPV
jgi:hypothetical protein